MKGDFTRITFDPNKHYSSVRMQQGRVQLDADWNEQVDINNHLTRTQSRDVIGASGVPRLEGGFQISLVTGDLGISPGRMYVAGLLCENQTITSYKTQPHFYPQHLNPSDYTDGIPSEDGLYLVYLDVWEAHVTAIEDTAIRESALGGPDTATRVKTIWQVKFDKLSEPLLSIGGGSDPDPSCWDVPSDWTSSIYPPKGGLKARTDSDIASERPCIVPAAAGYRRLENQLYRVEIHERMDDGEGGETYTFKWSRDNGIVASRVLTIDGMKLTVADIGKDEILHFASGQWVEVTDDRRLMNGEPGVLVRLAEPVSGNTLTIENWPGGGTPPLFDLPQEENAGSTIVRRWDHKGVNNANLDASHGALPITPGVEVELEDGVKVSFELDAGEVYKTGDYWLIPARVVGTDVEWPRNETGPLVVQPHGIQHHYSKLALVRLEGGEFAPLLTEGSEYVRDCRPLFPALNEPDLYYVSGDGQEAMPGKELPQPLRVGVSNCNQPVQGAWVRFEIVAGNGFLKPDTSVAGYIELASNDDGVTAFAMPTDANGEVKTIWQLESLTQQRLDDEVTEPRPQLVRASLIRSPDSGVIDSLENQLDVPVMFGASFGVAWENQYGGTCFPDKAHPQTMPITVEDALDQLRENIAIHYVGGDGQEVTRATFVSETDPRLASLPQVLQVRVANGDWPYENATVRFSLLGSNGGQLSDSNNSSNTTNSATDYIDVLTDGLGMAGCIWALNSREDATPQQQVMAQLISIAPCDDSNKPWPYAERSKLIFSANLSIAEQVTYDGSDFPDLQHSELVVDNVEAALDQLRENITLYYVGGDGQEVIPGESVAQPLQVRVANNGWPVAEATVRFHITSDSNGVLTPRAESGVDVISDAEFTVSTNEHGLAECDWQLDPNVDHQQVTATLETFAGTALIAQDSIVFNANTSTATKVFYDSSATETKWNEINSVGDNPVSIPPTTVQSAIDNLVNNMESGDIGYTVPDCPLPGEPAKAEGVPLFKQLLNASGSTNVKALWDKLLCNLDAAILPYTPNNKLARWEDIMDPEEMGGGGSGYYWSKSFGGTSADLGYGVATDSAGNAIIVGYFYDTVNFGGADLTSAGGADMFVAKFDPQGGHLWSQRFGGTSSAIAQKVAVDAGGNIMIGGYYSGKANFGGSDMTSVGSNDLFVVKLDADGKHVWSQGYGGTSGEVLRGLCVDQVGNAYITGYFSGAFTFGETQLTSAGSSDLFVARVLADGSADWAKSLGSTNSDIATSIAVDSQGNVAVTGYFNGTVNLGGSDLTSSGGNDVFILKLSSDGAHIWSRSTGDVGSDIGQSIAIDSEGNVVVAGYFQGTVNFGGDDITSQGGYDSFVAKFDADGQHLWSHGYGGTSTDVAMGLAVDSLGQVFLTGYFSGTANFGGDDLTSHGSYDLYAVKLGPDGSHIWSQAIGGSSGTEIPTVITVDVNDFVLITGYFNGTANFGGEDHVSVGSNDIFLLKLGVSRPLPVTVQAAIDTLVDNLESSDIRYRGRNVKDVLDELFHIASNVAIPAGTVISFAGSKPPSGWLECNGQAINRSDYAALYSTIGTNFGAGDGNSTFNLPNLVGRVPIGSGIYQDADGYSLTLGIGQTHGQARHRLVVSEMPAHSHPAYANTWAGVDNSTAQGWPRNDVHQSFRSTDRSRTNVLNSGAIGNAGGNAPHNNLQPSLVVRYLIKT